MLLDTTVLIDVLRTRGPIIRRLYDHGGPFCASVISLDELVYGMRPGEEDRTEMLIDGLQLLPVGQREARLAGAWRRLYGKRGKTLELGDCLIAATAASAGLALATANVKDFPMPEITVEHWPSE